MKTFTFIITLSIISQIISCTKPYALKLDDIDKRIVVDAFFCTDSLMRISLTEDASLSVDINTGYTQIKNAQILLYENDVLIDTADYKGNGIYYGDFKPKIDILYKLQIKAKGFPDVEAEDKIPKLVEIDSLSKGLNDGNYGDYKVKYLFNDPDGINNYYLISVGSLNEWGWYESYYRTDDIAIGEWFTQMDQLPIFNDDIFNGEKYELPIELAVNIPFGNYQYFRLYSISESMYSYLKSYNNQAPKFGDDMMEYFQRGLIEPIPVYSNIKGGLGIFAGYAVSQDSLYFE